MLEQSPLDVVRHSSTWSIGWGVLLIVFGVLAIGSPLFAAVAVSLVIAWLIILAGVVHLILAVHVHRAGSMIWKLLVGLVYLFFGVLPAKASGAGRGVLHTPACFAVRD